MDCYHRAAAWVAWGFGIQTTSSADQRSLRELSAFRLSLEKLSKTAEASKILEKLSEGDPSLKCMTQFDKTRGHSPSMTWSIELTTIREPERRSKGPGSRSEITSLRCTELSGAHRHCFGSWALAGRFADWCFRRKRWIRKKPLERDQSLVQQNAITLCRSVRLSRRAYFIVSEFETEGGKL